MGEKDFEEDKADIQRIVAETVKSEPLAIEYMASGGMSCSFRAVLRDGSAVIVRTNQMTSVFATTSRNIKELRRLGLPVPEVLAEDHSLSQYSFAYMVMNAFSGRDLRDELADMTHSQMTALAERLVEYQKIVATLPEGEGYGYVGIGEKGPSPSWIDVMPGQMRIAAGSGQAEHWYAQILELTAAYGDYFRSVPPICFLDDITVKNVIVERGELMGLVDFDCVCYGDPLWWIGLTAAGVVSDVGSQQLFYVDELCRLYGLTKTQEKIVPLYCAFHAVTFVARSDGSERREWHTRMGVHIERWLSQVS